MRYLRTGNRLLESALLVCGVLTVNAQAQQPSTSSSGSKFLDHSLLVAKEYPCNWPTHPFPKFQIVHQTTVGPASPYNIDSLYVDGNTGTQLDVPPHSVARPDLNRENSGLFGLATTEKIEAWQFGGEACVVDTRDLLDQAPKGVSPLVTPKYLEQFEAAHRKLRFGDVVLFRSDYSDRYYRPFPEGSRFINDVVDKKAPGYPDPNPETMEWLATRGVMALGTDSASMGPMPDLAEPTHYAGLRHGMIWTEGATGFGALPTTGAFYCFLGPKHQGGPYGEGRAFSIVGGELPKRLIESCKSKRAIDLSPTLTPKFPMTNPGRNTGEHRQVYLKIDFLYSDYLDMFHHGHMMDAMAGTHLVPPSYALPSSTSVTKDSPEVRVWLDEYEKRFGKRATSDLTTESVPIEWTCGEVRVLDVRSLAGTTDRANWPASPEITPAIIQQYEKENGELKPGQIVLFHTGVIDRYLKMEPDAQGQFGSGLWTDTYSRKTEGWPAPGPEAIDYLSKKGIRCVATDAPDLGGADPKRALMTYWALGSRQMVGVEFLSNVGSIPKQGGYFLFAALKIQDCHGGPGRAIVLY
ncbi:MAG: cyclase family protein [Pirellula sp.]